MAKLNPVPLPPSGVFDVVIIVGALCAGFAPVSVVRELCHAAKPCEQLTAVTVTMQDSSAKGGLVCITRGPQSKEYKKDLERELQLMEAEGLWSIVGVKQIDRYMQHSNLSSERDEDTVHEQPYLSGISYLYKKSSCENSV
nr:PREDICTED: Williams-Beuren syndrome chromosomal region 27 protein-like [Paralichthys olivaceus]